MCDGPDLFLAALAILFPPLAVWVKRGICSADSLINFCLCLLGYLPGLLHAWYIISSYPDPGYEPVDGSEPQIHVYYVRGGGPPPPSAGPGPGLHSTPQATYGTLSGSSAPAAIAAAPAQQQQQQQQPKPADAQPKIQEQVVPAASSSTAAAAAPAGEPAGGVHKLAGEEDPGPSEGPPPSYAEVVRGDNKIQSP